jgi:hypothetical protein
MTPDIIEAPLCFSYSLLIMRRKSPPWSGAKTPFFEDRFLLIQLSNEKMDEHKHKQLSIPTNAQTTEYLGGGGVFLVENQPKKHL